MNKIILTSASLLALSAAGPVFGQAVEPPECAGVVGNCSVIDATGTNVNTSVDQTGGSSNVSDIVQDGDLTIDGPGGRNWKVSAVRDVPPRVELMPEGARTNYDGQMSQPFRAIDDYAVVSGTASPSASAVMPRPTRSACRHRC